MRSKLEQSCSVGDNGNRREATEKFHLKTISKRTPISIIWQLFSAGRWLDEIEAALGFPLDWQELPTKTASRIAS